MNKRRAVSISEIERYSDKLLKKDIIFPVLSFNEIPDEIGFRDRVLSGIDELDYLVNGFEDGAVTILTAITNAGKTTLLTQLAVNAIGQGRKVWFFNGEQRPEDFKNIIYRQLTPKEMLEQKQYKNTNIKSYFANQESRKSISETLDGHFYIYKNDIERDIESLINAMKFSLATKGTTFFVIDNFMQIDMSGKNEFTEQSRVMEQIRTFAINYSVPVILVCHIRKGAEFNVRPSIFDIAGSMHIANKAYNVLSLMRTDMLSHTSKEYKQLGKDMARREGRKWDLRECDAVIEVLKTKGTSTGFVGLEFDSDTRVYKQIEKQHNDFEFEKEVTGNYPDSLF